MANSHGRHSSDDQHPEANDSFARGVGDPGDESANSADKPWHTRNDDPSKAAKNKRRKGDGSKSKSGSLVKEFAIIIGCVLAIMLVLTGVFGRQYVIPSESMEATLHGCAGCTNDRIVTDKLSLRFGDAKPGDVVVFRVPDSWDEPFDSPRSSNPVMHKVQDVLSWFGFAPPDENNYVKRVIAVGGQTVSCRNADGVGVKVDGKVLHEPYIDMNLQRNNVGDGLNSCLGPDFGPYKVPADAVWVMGDNRTDSSDSRYHMNDDFTSGGSVPVSDLRGKVRSIIWPVSRIGGVGSINPQQ